MAEPIEGGTQRGQQVHSDGKGAPKIWGVPAEGVHGGMHAH